MTTPNLYDGSDGVTVEADVAASEIGGTGTILCTALALGSVIAGVVNGNRR